MVEHDVGYDECDICNFCAIYDDGRQDEFWSVQELEEIYAKEADSYRKYLATLDLIADPSYDDTEFPF